VLNPSWSIEARYESYLFPADSRMTTVLNINTSSRRITRMSFLPALMNENSQPGFLNNNNDKFYAILKHVQKINETQDLDTSFTGEGSEVIPSSSWDYSKEQGDP